MEIRSDKIDGVQFAAVLDHNEIVALYARPDDDRLWVGDIVVAKITRYAAAQKAYFASHGKVEILLPHKSGTAFKPGQDVTILIERPATLSKHARGVESDQSPQRGPDMVTAAQADYPDADLSNKNLEDFDRVITQLRNNHVPLQNGVDIVIDQATALTAVDVNAAAPDLSFLNANKIAATSLFHEMTLRNIQGQIVVDFLRMRDAAQKSEFIRYITALAASHARPTALYGFTKLGLFELTREKHGLSLNDVFSISKK